VLFKAVQQCAEYSKAKINYMVSKVQELEQTQPEVYATLAPKIQQTLTELKAGFKAISWDE